MMKSLAAIGFGCLTVLGSFSGYSEVEVPVGDEYSAIICEVVGVNDGSYVQCENVYYKDDVIWLDKNDGVAGDLLHVTFEHDDVWMVRKIEDYKLIVK